MTVKKNPRVNPIERATGRSWDEWLRFMDSIDATSLDHKTIAAKVHEELDGAVASPGWWAQGVTVAYEQHMGRRVPGQRSDGTFETSVSRSTGLGMQELMDRWMEFAAADEQVLALIQGEPRVGGTEKRATWRTKALDGSSIVVTSEPKKNGTASLVATQTGLETHELNLEAKANWQEIIGRFLA